MSALHEAARRVVSAWVSTRPAWIEQCNAAVLALDAALKAEPAQEPAGCETEADCTSQPWCRISGECHRKQEQPEPAQEAEPYAWHYTNNAGASVWHRGPSTRLDADMQAARDYPRVHKVTPLYTAPPQRKPLTDEEIDRLWHDNGAGIDAERFARIARAIERKVRGEA